MRFIVGTIIVAITGYLLHLIFPFWAIALAGFLIGFVIFRTALSSFFGGFFGGFLLWFAMVFKINEANDGILSNKIGQLIGGLSSIELILISSLIAGLLGAMGTLSGYSIKNLFFERTPKVVPKVATAAKT